MCKKETKVGKKIMMPEPEEDMESERKIEVRRERA